MSHCGADAPPLGGAPVKAGVKPGHDS
jgi:hypothetical protein